METDTNTEKKARVYTRPYVGILENGTYETFRSEKTPTQASHMQYNAVIGPFKTMRGAKYMAAYGKSNPHLQHVGDAEIAAKLEMQKEQLVKENVNNE